MPMPMPIMVASEVDQSGASTKEMTTVVRVLLTARPAMATMIGRPAATTEPNVISRMIAAAARPIPSEPISPCSACTMLCPPRPTWKPSVDAASAISSICSLSAIGMSTGFSTSRRRCATRVVPSWLMPAGSWKGSETATTCSTVPSSASRSCTAPPPDPAMPPSARTTTSTVSPAWLGKRSSRSVCASLESDPGAE